MQVTSARCRASSGVLAVSDQIECRDGDLGGLTPGLPCIPLVLLVCRAERTETLFLAIVRVGGPGINEDVVYGNC